MKGFDGLIRFDVLNPVRGLESISNNEVKKCQPFLLGRALAFGPWSPVPFVHPKMWFIPAVSCELSLGAEELGRRLAFGWLNS